MKDPSYPEKLASFHGRSMGNVRRKGPSNAILAPLSILILGFVAFGEILRYFFTSPDTVSLISTARIQSIEDLFRIFLERTMGGTSAQAGAETYRPIALLSFALDYRLWGIDPFGYQLTNLLLHVLNAAMVFFLGRKWFPGQWETAWAASLIFLLHPLTVDNVPTPERRQEMLMTFFMLLSMWTWVRAREHLPFQNGLIWLSAVFFFLALGTKEVSVVLLPVFICAVFLNLRHDRSRWTGWTIQAIKECAPFIAVSAVFFAVRFAVLGGLGGYHRHACQLHGPLSCLKVGISIATSYFTDLFYPVSYFHSWLAPLSTAIGRWLSLVALTAFFLVMLANRLRIAESIRGETGREVRGRGCQLASIGAVLSLALLLAFPLWAPMAHASLEHFLSDGPAFVSGLIHRRGEGLDPSQLVQFRNVVTRTLMSSLIISLFAFAILRNPKATKKFFFETEEGRLSLFLALWLLLPLAIYLPMQTYFRRFLYSSLVPLSILIAMASVRAFRSAALLAGRSNAENEPRTLAIPGLTRVVLPGLLLFGILATSPLFHRPALWEEAGETCRSFLQRLVEVAKEYPEASVIRIQNLPYALIDDTARITDPDSVGLLADYSVKSWLDLQIPGNRIEVYAHPLQALRRGRVEPSWSVEKIARHTILVKVEKVD